MANDTIRVMGTAFAMREAAGTTAAATALKVVAPGPEALGAWQEAR